MITTSQQPIKLSNYDSTHPDNQLRLRWLWNDRQQVWERKMRKVVVRALECSRWHQRRWSRSSRKLILRDSNACRLDDVLKLTAEMSVRFSFHSFHSPICDCCCKLFQSLQRDLKKSKAKTTLVSMKPYRSEHLFSFDNSLSFYPISGNRPLNFFFVFIYFWFRTKLLKCLLQESYFCSFYRRLIFHRIKNINFATIINETSA